jgi:hypothetical protein
VKFLNTLTITRRNKMEDFKIDRENTFTVRDVAAVHKLAEKIYVAGFTNPADNGYVTASHAWDYAVGFHSHALAMWDLSDLPTDEQGNFIVEEK